MQKQQLAMAELPVQEMEELYAPEQALAAGTAFPDLDLPFFAVPEEMMETAPAAEDYQGKTEEQKKMMKKAPTNIKTPEATPVWFKEEIKSNEASAEEQKELEELLKGLE